MVKPIHGIDVSSNNPRVNFKNYHGTVFISKLTGGTSYTFTNNQLDEALKHGHLVGAYHFVSEYKRISPNNLEVKHFYNHFKKYLGKVLPILDYEIPINGYAFTYQDILKITDLAKQFYKLTKVNPVIYCSKSLVWNNTITGYLKKNNMFWIAQYANNNRVGWLDNPWQDKNKLDVSVIGQQYTAHGRVNGVTSDTDLSIFYISKRNWLKACKPNK